MDGNVVEHTGNCFHLPDAAFFPAVPIAMLQCYLFFEPAHIVPFLVKYIHIHHGIAVNGNYIYIFVVRV